MRRVTGLPDDQVTAWEAKLEQQVVDSLQSVMDRIAARIERIQVASVLVAVATTGPTGDDDPPPMTGELAIPEPVPLPEVLPPDAGLSPGQPYISPDDLASIAPMWQQAVAEQVLPLAAQVFIDSMGHVRSQFLDAVGPGVTLGLPGLGSVAAEEYLARARNTFDEIGDHLWATARAQLSEGFDAGESIPQLGARLRQSAGLSARTAVMVARTQVIEASNAGSIAMARASKLTMKKFWIATADTRTRPTHLDAEDRYEREPIDLADPFIVGGSSGDFPAASTFSPAERYGCRCTTGYVMPERQPALPGHDLAQLPGTTAPAAELEAAPEPALGEVLEPALGEVLEGRRPSLASARTVRDVDTAAAAEARRLTGRDIRFDQRGSDVEIARLHAEGILRGLERYPESPISQVGTYGPGSSLEAIAKARGIEPFDEVRGFTATLPGQDVIAFNVRMAGDPEAYYAALARGEAAGWHAAGTASPLGQALHEFGHTVDETFTPKGARIAAVRSQMIEKSTGESYKDAVRAGVSRYAATMGPELGAESFASAMMLGGRASPMARAVFDAIDSGYIARHPRVFPKLPGEAGFDLADFPEPPPIKVRSALLRARTDRELIAAWQGEMRAVTGRDIIVQLPPDSSVLTMREHAEGVLQMLERFPEARLRKISWYDTASTEYAHVRAGSGTLEFNAKWASTAHRREYLASLRHDVSGWDDAAGPGYGWSVRGAKNPQATSWHEMAHILSIETLGGKLKAEAMRITLRRMADAGTLDMGDFVSRQISAYAASKKGNLEEMIAEAMTDVMANGPRASLLSRELYDMVAREYRAKGFAVRTAEVPDLGDEFEDFTRIPDGEVFPKEGAPQLSLSEMARLTPVTRRKLEGGIAARTEEVTYADGQRAVEKDYLTSDGPDAELYARHKTTAEVLAADVLRVVGVRRPDIHRLDEHSFLMEFVEGTQGGTSGALKAPAKIVTSAEGRRLGLADALLGHRDRNGGNWMRAPDGGLVAIDNGGAFGGSERAAAGNPFVSFLMGRYDESPWKARIEMPSDIDLGEIRRGLTALRPKFAEIGYQRQFKEMMDRLTEIERRAVPVPPAPRLAPDLPVARPPSASPPPSAPRLATMKVGDLRALAKERGITVPAGTRKADLVRMLDETPSGPPALPVPVVPSTALPARVVAARAELERVALSPVVREDRLGGTSSYTFRQTTEAGDEYITKDYSRLGPGPTARRDADAEELGSLVMDALDVPTQAVVRLGPERVAVSVLRGDEPGFIGPLSTEAKRQVVADTDTGRMLGLGDMLIGNNDRSSNWVRLADGRPASYDLGSAFRTPKLAGAGNGDSAFSDFLLTPTRKAWAPNDMSPADLALIRQRLEALRPEFERLKRGTWFNQMMARLTEVEKRATGTRTRLAEAAGQVAEPAGAPSGLSAVRDATGVVTGRSGLVFKGRRPAWTEAQSAETQQALDRYATRSIEINRHLRSGGVDAPEAAGEVQAIDRVMSQSTISSPITVWRGVGSGRSTFGDALDGDLTGREWTDPAFFSTSVRESQATTFARGSGVSGPNLVMSVRVPPGARGVLLETGGEGELLLDRGYAYRVLRDRGVGDDGVRRIDVEVIPRGVPTPSVVSPEARAVARQAVIDERRAVADSLGEVRELLANGASERALASRARLIAGRTSGAASEDLAGLVKAMESGDADRIRVALGDVAQRRGLTEVGGGGADVVAFDPKIHEVVGGARRPPVGTFVQVQRPGYSVRLDDGEVVQLSKAKVDTLTVEEIAERTAAQERKALREAARERNRVVESQRATAKLLAEVDELAAKGATKTAIRERLDPALREAGQAYAGADAAVVDTISAALDSGDMAKIRAAVTRASTKAKIKPIGKAGAKTTFDPDTMEGVGGIDIAPGAKVTVVRRGSTLPGVETPEKAQVIPVRAASTAKTVTKGDFTGLTRVGERMGSNPGGLFEAGDGSRWYIKTATDPAQLRSEKLALDLYREAGLDVPDAVVGQGAEGLGSTQIASRFLGDATSDLRTRLADEAYRRQLQEGFAVDAWLGNWDVLGLGMDNVLTTAAGAPIRIEAGGALRFRAQGAAKAFGDEAGEFDTMREAGRGAGRAFADMTPEQLIASAERVRKITPTKIKALVKRNDLDPALAETLIARREDILRRADALAGAKAMTGAQFDRALKSAKSGRGALDAAPIDASRGTRGANPTRIEAISEAQQKALIGYRGHGFGPINDDLRGISPEEIDKKWHGFASRERIRESRDDVVRIDEILDQSRLTHDVVLYRGAGTGRSILGDPATWGDDLAGFTWRDAAYSSATASEKVAADFLRGLPGQSRLMLRLVAPKGTKAIRISDLGPGNADEAEMLLGRGATFRVARDRGWGTYISPTSGMAIPRVRTLDVEVIVPDKTPPLPWETK